MNARSPLFLSFFLLFYFFCIADKLDDLEVSCGQLIIRECDWQDCFFIIICVRYCVFFCFRSVLFFDIPAPASHLCRRVRVLAFGLAFGMTWHYNEEVLSGRARWRVLFSSQFHPTSCASGSGGEGVGRWERDLEVVARLFFIRRCRRR